MKKFGHSLKNGGYDQEEAHFHKVEQELIEKVRTETRKANHLKLIQGGKTIPPKAEATHQVSLPNSQAKKAA